MRLLTPECSLGATYPRAPRGAVQPVSRRPRDGDAPTLGANRHDEVLRATLLSNRAAAHVMLRNWAKAYDDASTAL